MTNPPKKTPAKPASSTAKSAPAVKAAPSPKPSAKVTADPHDPLLTLVRGRYAQKFCGNDQ